MGGGESVHEHDNGHDRWQAAEADLDGGIETGDRRRDVRAWSVDLCGGTTLRRQHEPVISLAASLSQGIAGGNRRERGRAAAGHDYGDPVAEQARAAADSRRIEIELPNGCRLRVDSAVDGKALRRILDVLERR